jgi:hypothetical protein
MTPEEFVAKLDALFRESGYVITGCMDGGGCHCSMMVDGFASMKGPHYDELIEHFLKLAREA